MTGGGGIALMKPCTINNLQAQRIKVVGLLDCEKTH
jgi:hypothetical protein